MSDTPSDKDDEVRPLPGALPCPFCGGTEVKSYPGSTFRWRYPACTECGGQAAEVRIATISMPRLEAITAANKDLLAAWNERAPLPESGTLTGETPRTDSIITGGTIGQNALLEHARQLERELAALREQLAEAREDVERLEWIDTLTSTGFDHMGYGDYRYYVHGKGYPKVRAVIDAARREKP